MRNLLNAMMFKTKMLREEFNREFTLTNQIGLPDHLGLGLISTLRGDFKVDIKEDNEEVVVSADLPGFERDSVSAVLVNPRSLVISVERGIIKEDCDKGYYMRERVYGNTERMVMLPADVTEDGSAASFKNGVLEIHLKKMLIAKSQGIPITA
jgi:HSP20 family protein